MKKMRGEKSARKIFDYETSIVGYSFGKRDILHKSLSEQRRPDEPLLTVTHYSL